MNIQVVPPNIVTETITCSPNMIRDIVKGMSLEDLFGDIHSSQYPDRRGFYQYTARGGIFFPLDPRPDEVFAEDIIAGAAAQHRFFGQTIVPMTIAQHQVIVSRLVSEWCALEALLHDAPESYIGDLIRPLKALPTFGDIYLKIEDGIAAAIAKRFKLVYPWPKEVLIADEQCVMAEVDQNIASLEPRNHVQLLNMEVKPGDIRLEVWSQTRARWEFTTRFRELAAKRGIDIGF